MTLQVIEIKEVFELLRKTQGSWRLIQGVSVKIADRADAKRLGSNSMEFQPWVEQVQDTLSLSVTSRGHQIVRVKIFAQAAMKRF